MQGITWASSTRRLALEHYKDYHKGYSYRVTIRMFSEVHGFYRSLSHSLSLSRSLALSLSLSLSLSLCLSLSLSFRGVPMLSTLGTIFGSSVRAETTI